MTTPTLLLIDIQQGLDDPSHGRRSTPQFEVNIGRLLAAWRARRLPLVHIKHDSIEPGSLLRPELPGNAFKAEALPLPGEPLFSKQANSAFIGTPLEAYLRERGQNNLVIAGLTTDHCVSTTARHASNLGFTVTLLADATAAHERTGYDGRQYTAEQIQQVSLATLHGEFCTVLDTADFLAGLE